MTAKSTESESDDRDENHRLDSNDSLYCDVKEKWAALLIAEKPTYCPFCGDKLEL